MPPDENYIDTLIRKPANSTFRQHFFFCLHRMEQKV